MEIKLEPGEYYQHLRESVRRCSRTIVLSALYLGHGPLEAALLDDLLVSLEKNKELHVTLLLDYHRSNRPDAPPEKHSLQRMRRINEVYPHRFNVYLYKVPQTAFITRSIASFLDLFQKKSVIHEVLGVYHCKYCIFDGQVVVTGANLSNEYFTNRQDRYYCIDQEVTSQFTNDIGYLHRFLTSFTNIIKDFSYSINGNSIATPKNSDNNQMRQRLQGLITTYKQEKIENNYDKNHTTFIPCIQHAQLNVTGESTNILSLLHQLDILFHNKTPYELVLTSAYPSFMPSMVSSITSLLRRKVLSQVALVMPSEGTHGFHKAAGIKALIPKMHQEAINEVVSKLPVSSGDSSVRVHYYNRPQWSYHAKGIWLLSPLDKSLSLPFFTYIGSSNFGQRSWERDLELGFMIASNHIPVRTKIANEIRYLCKDTVPGTMQHRKVAHVNWLMKMFRTFL